MSKAGPEEAIIYADIGERSTFSTQLRGISEKVLV